MFFRGAPFQRDEHGRYNLLPTTALSSKSAHLLSRGLTEASKQPRPDLLSSSVEQFQPFHQPSRRCQALGPRKSISPVPAVMRTTKGLARAARASDLCHLSIGESSSVS